jgi:FemAB-related protein (PEP-CTERM system-associated)
MNIRLAEKEDQHLWDTYVSTHPDGTPYHSYAWKQAIETAYGHKGFYLFAEEKDTIVGVLPLVRIRLPLINNELVALPFCDNGACLADGGDIRRRLIRQTVVLAEQLKIRSCTIRSHSENIDLEETEYPFKVDSGKVSLLLPLPENSEILWSNFKSKLRSQIRKSEKNGLTFVLDNTKVEDFYSVMSMNMRDLGSPVHSRQWFDQVVGNYGSNAHLGIVYLKEKPIGAGMLLSCGGKISIPWASTLRKYNKMAPNMLLYWNFLRYAADNYFSVFDFGRSSPGEGTYKFKTQWGARPKPLYWHILSLTATKSNHTSVANSKRRLVENIWRKLPLSIANFIGPKIRKHISL